MSAIAANPTPRPLDHLAECGADDDPALILRAGTLSYKDLSRAVGQMAAWLRAQVNKTNEGAAGTGARVASWAAKGQLTSLLPLAAARAGLVHVPINPLLKRAQVAHILGDSDAALLIGNQGRLSSLEQGDIPESCHVIEEDSVLEDAALFGDALPPSAANPDDLAAILYTSGSTGAPKGVMLSHANLWLGAVSVAHYLGLENDDVVLAVLPFSFDYGQNQLLSAWRAGACAVPLDYLFPRDVIKACIRHGITTLAALPPLWVQLIEQDWPEEATQSIRRITNSGGALNAEMVEALCSTFPKSRLFSMYGLTEAFRSTYLDPALVQSRPTSIGKAVPFAEILIIRDDGTLAAADEEGELVHCGPLVAQGYWRDAARSAERFHPAPEQSRYGGMAVRSGDRAKRSADGLLYFIGRRDAMIKSSGNRISPQEVEDAALATGLVAEAVALGVADARLGQAVHLVVRARGDAGEAERDLPAILARHLPNFMQPQKIHWKEKMPINPNGKVDRAGLAKELQEVAP